MYFRGLSAFPLTPCNARGEVDVLVLEKLLSRLRLAGVDSIGLLGSTGLYAFLTRNEKRRAIEAAVSYLKGDIPVMVSAGALRTDDAVKLAQDAGQAGADGILLAPVSYTPLREEEVFQHYTAVAQSTSLPVCIYNNPATTHFTFTPTLLARLGAVGTIRALKYPAPPQIDSTMVASLRELFPADFAVGFSVDWHAPEALLSGGDIWFSVLGGLLPKQALALTRAAQAGDRAKVGKLYNALQPLWDLFISLSSLRVIYSAAEILGICQPVLPRPLLPLQAAERKRVERVLLQLGVQE